MKRSILIILIVGSLLFLGTFFQCHMLKEVSENSKKMLTDISVNTNNIKEIQNTYLCYNSKWDSHKSYLSLLVSHDEIDAITRHNSRLNAFIQDYSLPDLHAEINELIDLYDQLNKKFKISLKNIL